jgi:PhzF family phenazine biosynthesis protein
MKSEAPAIWQVDAFTDCPFAGNPAAICLLDAFPSDVWMQHVAAEMNLSETSFLVPCGQGNRFQLRWFTPAVEVDLCGHATLAAAHLLFEQGIARASEELRFKTRSGELVCTRRDDDILLDFPATPPMPLGDERLGEQLSDALGITAPSDILRSRFDLMVVADEESVVRRLSPDFGKLAKLDTRGVIVTAVSHEPGIDFVSRYFAPRCGIDEDPVTGSAHCCLAPYWSAKLKRTRLTGFQASKRGGTVGCEVAGDRVKLSGQAVTVLSGQLLVGPW